MSADGVHPNDQGYIIVASTVYQALTAAPVIVPNGAIFLQSLTVAVQSPALPATIRYTLDGSEPGPQSLPDTGPFAITKSTVVKARAFWLAGGQSLVTTAKFARAVPLPSVLPSAPAPGLSYDYYEAPAAALERFAGLTALGHGVVDDFSLTPRRRDRDFGFSFRGYIEVPADGLYQFFTASDDGSLLDIDNHRVVNNFRSHNLAEQSGKIALQAGRHLIAVDYYQDVGAMGLQVSFAGPGLPKQLVPVARLSHEAAGTNAAATRAVETDDTSS
jgi:hexosaminidase